MALALRSDVVLEKAETEGCVLLYKREPSHRPAPVFRLHPIQAMVLALFDGTRNVEEITPIVTAVLGRPPGEARRLIESIFGRYRQFLCEGDRNVGSDAVDPADLLFPVSCDFREMRDPAPAGLMWVVTECCNKKCRYCYKDAFFVANGGATDVTLSGARVAELIAEAAEIGVTNILLTGGEPFLRPDLIDLIAVMVGHGLDVVPLTKDRITGDRMRALVRSGVKMLEVSLDSHRPQMVDFLTGVPGAFEQIVATLRAAADCGLPVVLRPVLTSFNVNDFEGLVALANNLKVREVVVDFYGGSCGRQEEALRVSPVDTALVRAKAAELAERFPQTRTEFRHDRTEPVIRIFGRGCMEGSRGMTILPDGKVTKCEHWRSGDELIYGDLRTQSIMEVWQSDRIAQLTRAPREMYAGTTCARCKKFVQCNERRGRCTLSALLEYDTPYAPDGYCPIGAFRQRRDHAATA